MRRGNLHAEGMVWEPDKDTGIRVGGVAPPLRSHRPGVVSVAETPSPSEGRR